MRYEVEVEVDFHQFYIWDAGTEPLPPDDYDEKDIANRVKVDPSILVVQPERNGPVPVVVEIYEKDPGCNRSNWDHVVECSVNFPTGAIQVHECTGGVALEFEVAPGTYQARILFGGIETLSYDGTTGEDHYAIRLWPGPERPLKISKRWVDVTEG